jgi:type I restriction enzyme S subunit
VKHWGRHRLGELVEILSGFAFDSENFADSGEMPIVRIRDVVRGRSQTFYKGKYDEKYVLRDGDMLIGMDGEFNLARWQSGPALLNQRVCRIGASNGVLDDDYLFRFLPAALKAIEDVTPYVTVKHLSVKTIREIEIPMPPLAEQRRITIVLGRAEALRAKRRAALAQLDSLTQSIFLDMFGDPVANPKQWPNRELGSLLTFQQYGPRFHNEAYSKDGIRIVRITDLDESGTLRFSDMPRMLVSPEDQSSTPFVQAI